MGEGGILRGTSQRPPHPPRPSLGGPGPQGLGLAQLCLVRLNPPTPPLPSALPSPFPPQPLEPRGGFASISPKLFRPHPPSLHSLGFSSKPGPALGTGSRLVPALMEQLLGGQCGHCRGNDRGPLWGQKPTPLPPPCCKGCGEGVLREPVRDLLTFALLPGCGIQSHVPPKHDRCQASPALPSCPPLAVSSTHVTLPTSLLGVPQQCRDPQFAPLSHLPRVQGLKPGAPSETPDSSFSQMGGGER